MVGTGVVVTSTAVGGAEVKVGSAAIPVVEVGTARLLGRYWLAGGCLPVICRLPLQLASSTSSTQVKNTLLFIVASLDPDAKSQ